MISFLKIENFKSIKNLHLKDLKKINLLIGKPNTGKSNIIEALSTFSLHFIDGKKDLIRYEKISNLFYDNNVLNIAKIKVDDFNAYLGAIHNICRGLIFNKQSSSNREIDNINEFDDIYTKIKNFINRSNSLNLREKNLLFTFTDDKIQLDVNFSPEDFKSSIFRFKFKLANKYDNSFGGFLLPPYADNLIYMLMSDPELYDDFGKIFAEYGLELLTNEETKSFEIQKKIGFRVYKYPFSLVADTLQRIIFYLSIIRFTKNKTIVLEEPETNSFPPYVRLFAEKIILDNSNQYFISTHNPYLVTKFLEKAFDDTNIILTYFEDYQTKAKVLTEKEKHELVEFDEDIFFNYEKYIN